MRIIYKIHVISALNFMIFLTNVMIINVLKDYIIKNILENAYNVMNHVKNANLVLKIALCVTQIII